MGLQSLMQSSRWGRFHQVDTGYSYASNDHDKASFPCTFLSARNTTIMDKNSINQWQYYFMPLLPSFNKVSTLVWHGKILNILKFSVIHRHCPLFSLQTLLSHDLYIPLNTRTNMWYLRVVFYLHEQGWSYLNYEHMCAQACAFTHKDTDTWKPKLIICLKWPIWHWKMCLVTAAQERYYFSDIKPRIYHFTW